MSDMKERIAELVKHGADIDVIIRNCLEGDELYNNLTTLLESGASVNYLLYIIGTPDVWINLDKILESGIDINDVIPYLDSAITLNDFDKLAEKGADLNLLARHMSIDTKHVPHLLKRGVDADAICEGLGPVAIGNIWGALLEKGASIKRIVEKMSPLVVYHHREALMRNGADIYDILKKMKTIPEYLLYDYDHWINHGATVEDIAKLLT